ncbi:hypothetical protein [Protofrankia coriariae]|uniref:Mce-associated membrane protein n=1 Tax=Protofrankia coriariae TaxID=1562887 RepID=A0ABR5F3E0_9ACTN|nr:hypothetical protein [Protofrankia coriariae]KLL11245.1 hypothetical protein FrCorBMG51_12535 [Protofrankia coriariae]
MALRLTARKTADNGKAEGHDQDAEDDTSIRQEQDQERDQAQEQEQPGDRPGADGKPARPAGPTGGARRSRRAQRSRRGDAAPRYPRARQVTGFVLAGLLVIAVAASAWQGLRWWAEERSGDNAKATFTADRDAAITAGQDSMVIFNTVDYRQPAEGLERWANASTGALQDKVRQENAQITKTITDTRTVSTARLIQGGLVAFDRDAGTAKVIAVIEIRSVPEGQPATTERTRLTGDVTRTAAGWKLSSIQTVPAGT